MIDILKVKKIIVVRGAACIILRKDTVSPLSHQMMASSNCFNFKQVFAPSEKNVDWFKITFLGKIRVFN